MIRAYDQRTGFIPKKRMEAQMCRREESRPSDIVLVRHGQSVWNAWKDYGHDNVAPQMKGVPDHKTPLTPDGFRQSEETGTYLAQAFPQMAVIYHSPYLRTTETAKTIAEQFPTDVPLYRDLLLIEKRYGWLDAGVISDPEEYRRLEAAYENFRKKVGKFYGSAPNGECWCDVCIRTHGMLDKFFRPVWHQKIIGVVSHAVTIATFLYHLAGRDEEETERFYESNKLKNCGIVHFRYNSGAHPRWELVEWNKTVWTP